MANQLLYKIGVVGPNRVGKTSLITSILKDTQTLLSNTSLSIHPEGKPTKLRLDRHRKELEGSLYAKEFNPGGLKGTEEPFKFELMIDPGMPEMGIRLGLLDYPGGWIDDERRPEGREKDWNECLSWINESSVLLVPIDSAVLMEADQSRYQRAVPWILTTTEVEDIARMWAKERKQRNREPALLILCPLKCESYFTDNGGQRDESKELFDKVSKAYSGLLKSVRDEASHCKIIYAPVDTIGCVEILSAKWKEEINLPGGFEFSANYLVRNPGKQNVLGADAVLIALCKHLVEAKQGVAVEIAREHQSKAVTAKERAKRDEGFFTNIWLWLNGERDLRNKIAVMLDKKSRDDLKRVLDMDEVINQLSKKVYGSRVHEL